jgi:hypothetical protein
MLSWLVAAEAFRLAYPAARRGRKVAYLTLAGFVFLVFTLASFVRHDTVHGGREEQGAGSEEQEAQSEWGQQAGMVAARTLRNSATGTRASATLLSLLPAPCSLLHAGGPP